MPAACYYILSKNFEDTMWKEIFWISKQTYAAVPGSTFQKAYLKSNNLKFSNSRVEFKKNEQCSKMKKLWLHNKT
jgi:hypothetical protein